ncbi:MAG: PilZ domain-containing protein [Myxococcales bacterium]
MPRLRTTLPIRLPDGWSGEVVDLSASGLRVRTMAVIPVETVIDVKIEHRGHLIPARMTVVWAEPPNFDVGELGELGLQVAEVSEPYLQLAAELFAND